MILSRLDPPRGHLISPVAATTMRATAATESATAEAAGPCGSGSAEGTSGKIAIEPGLGSGE